MCAVISCSFWAGWLKKSPRTPQLLRSQISNLKSQISDFKPNLKFQTKPHVSNKIDRDAIRDDTLFKTLFQQ